MADEADKYYLTVATAPELYYHLLGLGYTPRAEAPTRVTSPEEAQYVLEALRYQYRQERSRESLCRLIRLTATGLSYMVERYGTPASSESQTSRPSFGGA
jgi:hypothetical protein